jgi:Fe-S cluster assembly protein SufD
VERHRGLVEPFLARLANPADRAFTALNTAFLRDGLFLHLPDESVVPEPIHLLFVTQPAPASAGGAAIMTHPRNLIVAGPGSRASLVESYVGPQESEQTAGFTNAVTEISLARNAVLDHYSLQRHGQAAFHVATTQVRQERSSRYTSHAISLGAALARYDIDVVLAEEGAECTLNGLYMTAGRQQVDFHTTIDHARPNCVSRELYKGVLDGHSRGVFNGKIIVRTDARGTDSIQANRNLLLSADALVDTKPELQIFNNDVKCKHAAAIGQLDEKALFYLRSRAIGLEAARSLLIHAFVSDIVGRISVEPLREALETLLLARLPEYSGVKEAAL